LQFKNKYYNFRLILYLRVVYISRVQSSQPLHYIAYKFEKLYTSNNKEWVKLDMLYMFHLITNNNHLNNLNTLYNFYNFNNLWFKNYGITKYHYWSLVGCFNATEECWIYIHYQEMIRIKIWIQNNNWDPKPIPFHIYGTWTLNGIYIREKSLIVNMLLLLDQSSNLVHIFHIKNPNCIVNNLVSSVRLPCIYFKLKQKDLYIANITSCHCKDNICLSDLNRQLKDIFK
jgi:hypothetical protein